MCAQLLKSLFPLQAAKNLFEGEAANLADLDRVKQQLMLTEQELALSIGAFPERSLLLLLLCLFVCGCLLGRSFS